MAIVFRCWNPGEYIQKIVISFLTVPFDEMNYGVRHVKLFKIQNRRLQVFCKIGFFKKLLNSQKYTCVWVSFIIRLQVNFASEQFMSNCSYRTITDNGFWKWKSFFPSKLIIKVKPIDSHWFKMSCLTCLIFSCVYCFFLKRWNYIKIFVLHE